MNFSLQTYKKFRASEYEAYVIGADIGGTNARIGFAGTKKNSFRLLFSITYPTQLIRNISDILNHAKDKAKELFGITVKQACIAAAGPIINNRNTCVMTNANMTIRRRMLETRTKIKILPLINDLEAISESLQYLKEKDLQKIQEGKPEGNQRQVVIAAGTGLGKCMIIPYDRKKIIISSEFGNNDFPAYTTEELDFLKFIKQKRKIRNPPRYEDIISGPGIELIYDYITRTKVIKESTKFKEQIRKAVIKSVMINKLYKKDPVCKETIRRFIKYYARFAKNVALNDLPLGGLYIGGGIAKNHTEFFNNNFLKEFTNSATHQKILKSIPVFVITNDVAGLIGACGVAARNN